MRAVRFKAHQLDELKSLGALPEQIELLEHEALPKIRDMLKRPAPRNAVLEELQVVERAIRDAHAAIERLLNATDATPHRRAARSAILGGGYRHSFDGISLNEASIALVRAAKAVDWAVKELPVGPTRHQVASPVPVEVIHDALQRGGMYAGAGHQVPRQQPSASPTSRFRKIVGVCYEAIHAPSNDPERAIKAYVKQWRELMAAIESEASGTERPRKT